ncbi:MlaD family protein [Chelativorans sp. YIM 93263]|uniref:MlaD family protein n=1 Tax=Chelativorans sp. YIM 93263 TaxID=2906648 RepID=UPI002379553A|nr:MlaD family protein [Chelativorans sp. YIM 93263]
METRANYVLVGLFTILTVLAAFGFIYWTAGIGERGEMAQVRFRIPGSASGLGRGSAVLFNGVNVGNIQRVYLDVNNPGVAIADAEVNRQTPITHSTKADVGLAGLTGQANIEMSGGNPQEQNLLEQAEQNDTIPVINASPSAVSNLLQTAQSLLTRADSLIGNLEGFVSTARGPLTATLDNVEQVTKALADNSDGIDDFLKSVGDLSDTITGVSNRLDSTLQVAEELVSAVDRDKVSEIVDNVDNFTRQMSTTSERLEAVMTGVEETVTSINSFSQNANQTLNRVDTLIGEVDPESVSTAVRNFEQASAEINRASTDIAKVSQTVSGRSEDIDQFITNAEQLAEQLNRASVRVNDVIAKVDNMMDSGDGGDLMTEARETLTAFRNVAETLNARVGTIADNLERFSGQGLGDVEALVNQSRRSIMRIERAITEFEQNPQRIITGGEGDVRRYDGRNRR